MAIKRIATAVLLAAVSIMVVTAILVSMDDSQSEAKKPTWHDVESVKVNLPAQPEPDPVETAMAYVEQQQHVVGSYIATLMYEEAERQVAAENAAIEAYLASLYVPPPPPPAPAPSQSYSVGSTVGECTGFAIPDYIIQRESGGNPSAYNPSGAYGCAQTLLSHYNGGSCSGLDPYTIEGQRQCVLILSNGGTNLAPWAETR